MDEAIAILKLCADGFDALDRARALRRRRARAVRDGDDDRGRLHDVRAPRDRLPRHARAPDADHDERRPRARARRTASRSSSCRPGTTITACRRATATPRTSPARSSAREIGVTTDEQASWWGGRGIGTVPHALIAVVRRRHGARRDEVRRLGAAGHEHHRARRLRERLRAAPRSTSRTRSARRLWGVRLDTSESLVDRSLWERAGRLHADRRERAARPEGARRARRRRLRARCASSSRAASPSTRSASSRRTACPVDAYGVGSSLIRGSNDFTADIVVADGEPSAKVGRRLRPNPRLELVT